MDVGEVVVVVDKVEDADMVEEKLEKSVSVLQKQFKEVENVQNVHVSENNWMENVNC